MTCKHGFPSPVEMTWTGSAPPRCSQCEIESLRKRVEELESDRNHWRRMFGLNARSGTGQKIVDRLIACYRDNPLPVATALDERIDRSGNLLGWVRDAARGEVSE